LGAEEHAPFSSPARATIGLPGNPPDDIGNNPYCQPAQRSYDLLLEWLIERWWWVPVRHHFGLLVF
jgi:hypothetical protein